MSVTPEISIFRELWSQTLGKVGLVLAVIIVAISIAAAITMPPDFVYNWSQNYERAWIEYPKLVPPEWISRFGVPIAKHMIVHIPGENYNLTRAKYTVIVRYETYYTLDKPVFPDPREGRGLLVILRNLNNITYKGEVVTKPLEVYIERPDGGKLWLTSEMIKFAGQDMIVIQPQQVLILRASEFVNKYCIYIAQKIYHINISICRNNSETIKSRYVEAVFGIPIIDNKTGVMSFKPLVGKYRIWIQMKFSRLSDRDMYVLDRIIGYGIAKDVEFVVIGSAYGLLGTDLNRRDLAQGIFYGFPVALLIGFFAAVAATFIGMFIGVMSGYYGGKLDEVVQRIIDIVINVPLLPILVLVGVAIQTIIQAPFWRLMVIIGFLIAFSWGGVAIITRSMALSIKAEPYIEAAVAAGASHRRIVFKHVIPQVIPYVFAVLVFSVPAAILTEAGLSVLGIYHGMPTWGLILAEARRAMPISLEAWWWILPPGIMISLTSFTFVALGIALETVVEPRLRRT